MNNIKQALESAIKAMLSMEATIARNLGVSISDDEANAVLECKAALAELDKCEPVAKVCFKNDNLIGWNHDINPLEYLEDGQPLYTFPPQQQWVGLSWQDFKSLEESNNNKPILEVIKNTDAKLKQLNTKG